MGNGLGASAEFVLPAEIAEQCGACATTCGSASARNGWSKFADSGPLKFRPNVLPALQDRGGASVPRWWAGLADAGWAEGDFGCHVAEDGAMCWSRRWVTLLLSLAARRLRGF